MYAVSVTTIAIRPATNGLPTIGRNAGTTCGAL